MPFARGWWPSLAVLGAALLLSLTLALAFPLVDPDEGRNAEVAREMAETGDIIVPHLAGMPYLDKPPALFWAALPGLRVLGPTPLAVRRPAIVSGLLTLIALILLARRHESRAFAWRVAALTASAPLFAVLSAYVIFDMPLTLCVTVVWTLLARQLEPGLRPAGERVVMFGAVTIGILLKGPVMLAWALGGSLAAAILVRSRRPLGWLAWLPGWAIVGGIAGGWFALACRRYPEYPHYAFVVESFERMTTGSFRREQPLWFVPAVLVGGALPWSLTTPWWRLRGSAHAGRAARSRETDLVALGFVAFAAILFTVSRSKLVTYLLPAVPPLAWLAARAWSDERSRGSRALRTVLVAGLAFTPALLAIAGPRLHAYAREHSGLPLARAVMAAAGPDRVRYEYCYSPGTDFVLGRRGDVVTENGSELRSTYLIRYRALLGQRGAWTALDRPPARENAAVVVRRAGDARPVPPGWSEIYRDRRLVAWRTGSPVH